MTAPPALKRCELRRFCTHCRTRPRRAARARARARVYESCDGRCAHLGSCLRRAPSAPPTHVQPSPARVAAGLRATASQWRAFVWQQPVQPTEMTLRGRRARLAARQPTHRRRVWRARSPTSRLLRCSGRRVQPRAAVGSRPVVRTAQLVATRHTMLQRKTPQLEHVCNATSTPTQRQDRTAPPCSLLNVPHGGAASRRLSRASYTLQLRLSAGDTRRTESHLLQVRHAPTPAHAAQLRPHTPGVEPMTPPTRDGQVRTARRRKRRRRAALRLSPKSRCRRRRTRRRRLVVGFAALVAPRGWGDFCLALEGHSTRPPRTERTECSRRAVQAGSSSHVSSHVRGA